MIRSGLLKCHESYNPVGRRICALDPTVIPNQAASRCMPWILLLNGPANWCYGSILLTNRPVNMRVTLDGTLRNGSSSGASCRWNFYIKVLSTFETYCLWDVLLRLRSVLGHFIAASVTKDSMQN